MCWFLSVKILKPGIDTQGKPSFDTLLNSYRCDVVPPPPADAQFRASGCEPKQQDILWLACQLHNLNHYQLGSWEIIVSNNWKERYFLWINSKMTSKFQLRNIVDASRVIKNAVNDPIVGTNKHLSLLFPFPWSLNPSSCISFKAITTDTNFL